MTEHAILYMVGGFLTMMGVLVGAIAYIIKSILPKMVKGQQTATLDEGYSEQTKHTQDGMKQAFVDTREAVTEETIEEIVQQGLKKLVENDLHGVKEDIIRIFEGCTSCRDSISRLSEWKDGVNRRLDKIELRMNGK